MPSVFDRIKFPKEIFVQIDDEDDGELYLTAFTDKKDLCEDRKFAVYTLTEK